MYSQVSIDWTTNPQIPKHVLNSMLEYAMREWLSVAPLAQEIFPPLDDQSSTQATASCMVTEESIWTRLKRTMPQLVPLPDWNKLADANKLSRHTEHAASNAFPDEAVPPHLQLHIPPWWRITLCYAIDCQVLSTQDSRQRGLARMRAAAAQHAAGAQSAAVAHAASASAEQGLDSMSTDTSPPAVATSLSCAPFLTYYDQRAEYLRLSARLHALIMQRRKRQATRSFAAATPEDKEEALYHYQSLTEPVVQEFKRYGIDLARAGLHLGSPYIQVKFLRHGPNDPSWMQQLQDARQAAREAEAHHMPMVDSDQDNDHDHDDGSDGPAAAAAGGAGSGSASAAPQSLTAALSETLGVNMGDLDASAYDPGVDTFLMGYMVYPPVMIRLGHRMANDIDHRYGSKRRRLFAESATLRQWIAAHQGGVPTAAQAHLLTQLHTAAKAHQLQQDRFVDSCHLEFIRFMTALHCRSDPQQVGAAGGHAPRGMLLIPDYRPSEQRLKANRLSALVTRKQGSLRFHDFRVALASRCQSMGVLMGVFQENYTTALCGFCAFHNRQVGAKKVTVCPLCHYTECRDGGGARKFFFRCIEVAMCYKLPLAEVLARLGISVAAVSTAALPLTAAID